MSFMGLKWRKYKIKKPSYSIFFTKSEAPVPLQTASLRPPNPFQWVTDEGDGEVKVNWEFISLVNPTSDRGRHSPFATNPHSWRFFPRGLVRQPVRNLAAFDQSEPPPLIAALSLTQECQNRAHLTSTEWHLDRAKSFPSLAWLTEGN